ncbi:MAG: ImuA family protein [Rubripirellula sp.]
MTTQQTFGFLDVLESPAPKMRKAKRTVSAIDRPRKILTSPVASPALPICEQADPDPVADRQSMLRDLRRKVGCIHVTPSDGDDGEPVLSTGSAAIDGLLPRAGLRVDAITEWVAQTDGCGAAALAMITAAIHLESTPGPLVIVSGRNFYPPAAIALGVPAERIILVQPNRHPDVVWSVDQALRCQTVAAVWAHLGPNLDDRDARRFQLACEAGRTPGLFVRPLAVRGRPSFADVRFHVRNPSHRQTQPVSVSRSGSAAPLGRQMQVTLDRCRGGTIDRSAWIQIDDQARILPFHPAPEPQRFPHAPAALRLASELAHPTASNQSSSAKPGQRRA